MEGAAEAVTQQRRANYLTHPQAKRLFGYFAYVIAVGFVFLQLLKAQAVLRKHAMEIFDHYSPLIFMTVFPVFLGLLFALPGFVKTLRCEGKWQIDWVKLLAVGLPALYGTTYLLFFFTPIGRFLPFAGYLSAFGGSDFSLVSGIVFGYTLLRVVKKG
jgi:hypothetical protein